MSEFTIAVTTNELWSTLAKTPKKADVCVRQAPLHRRIPQECPAVVWRVATGKLIPSVKGLVGYLHPWIANPIDFWQVVGPMADLTNLESTGAKSKGNG